MTGEPDPTGVPEWAERIGAAARTATVADLSSIAVPATGGRDSAVLLLLGEQDGDGPDVLLIERATTLRSHAGQPAFPGGSLDPGDAGPVGAALREAAEETGLDPAGVDVLGCAPALYVPPSGYVVTPVVGWWRAPTRVWVRDPLEVASVHRVPLSELLDPANRVCVRHPSGYVGPAFTVRGLLVWGFTGGLLSRLLALAGLERPWDATRTVDLPPAQLHGAARGRGSVA